MSVQFHPTDSVRLAPSANRRPFRTDIQGLRAVAVILVLLDHAGLRFLSGGFVGVDVFFVISGFLISGHLVESLHRTGRIDFVGFYSARARRILPAALVTIVATAIASVAVVSPLRIVEILEDAVASALYVPNLVFAVRQTDYLAGSAPSPFQHFWSLGVEEQFYIVWPVLLLAAFLLFRRSHLKLMVVVGAVTVMSFIASVITTVDAPSTAFFSPHTRAWEFGVGALLAGAVPLLARVSDGVARWLTWLGLIAIVLAAGLFAHDTDYPGTAALLPVMGAALIVGFGGRGPGGASTVLGLRPVQFVGAISYSLYLVHWPVLVLVHEHIGLETPLPPLLGLALVVASVPLAWLMFLLVESPFRRKRRSARATLTISVSITVALVGVLFASSAAAAQLPLTADREKTQPETAVRLPAGTPFVPANISPSLVDAIGDTGEIYTNGCQQNRQGSAVLSCPFGAIDSQRTIALFGDSHAGRWFPALDEAATALDYRLDTYTKSGCRSEETAEAWSSSDNATCTSWRNTVVEMLNAQPPDVIVLSNHLGPSPKKDPSTMEHNWREGLGDLLDRLPPSSTVITIADTPEFGSSPVLCLSSNLENAHDCSVNRSAALNPSIRAAQVAAAEEHGAHVIDLTDYFCNERDCPAVIGATLVYADEHHLTATYSRTLAGVLQQRLAPLLE